MKITEIDMALYAHPDDGPWVAGGTLARMARLGRLIHQVMITSGGYDGKSNTKAIREAEERAGMDVLGMRDLHLLDFPDGKLNSGMRGDIVRAVLDIIDRYRADWIVVGNVYSFGPDGFTGHPDHKEVASVAEELFKLRPIKELRRSRMQHKERGLWPDEWYLGDKRIVVPHTDIRGCVPVDISDTVGLKTEAIYAHTSKLLGENGGLVQIGRIYQTPPVEHFDVWKR